MSATGASQRSTLHSKLWGAANDVRGSMELNTLKDYLLVLMFHKYLSEKMDFTASNIQGEETTFKALWDASSEEDKALIREAMEESLGFFIEPKHTFAEFVKEAKGGNSNVVVKLQDSLNAIQSSSEGLPSHRHFDGLFSSVNLGSDSLGKNSAERSDRLAKMILRIDDALPRYDEKETDVFGDAYEYLIGQFAGQAGKKGGEFYTPKAVSQILAGIVTHGRTSASVYDPTCGSGSLLLSVGEQLTDEGKPFEVTKYAGQELTTLTYNLGRMNLILHGVSWDKIDMVNDDTLTSPGHLGDKFGAIVANPPYSLKWGGSADPKVARDDRFTVLGGHAPKQYADLSFVQHMLYHLEDDGVMAVVLPHGILFRGAAEGRIREEIVRNNLLDAVISLPTNIFYGTGIGTVVAVFKKGRTTDEVLFVDASSEFVKSTPRNYLSAENVETIVRLYKERSEVEKVAHVASFEEIEENDFNLNIPRYVDATEDEEPVDLDAVSAEIVSTRSKIAELDGVIEGMIGELRWVE